MKTITIYLLLIIFCKSAFSQSITLTPNTQSMIDANSTTQGVLFPRMNSTQRTNIVSPANGLLVYDTDTNGFWYSQNGVWTELPKNSLWSVNGLAGNEIRNTNAGGFWSSNPTILPFIEDNGLSQTAPTSGAGTRLMWVSSRSAFRCGTVNGDAWDAANVGLHSFASGYNSRATGLGCIAFGTNAISDGTSNTIAFGENTRAIGTNGLAMGYGARVNAQYGVAIGNNSIADGTSNTLAFGELANASGTNGVAIGTGINANSYYSVAMGYYNVIPVANATSWVATDPLFTIGNGQSNAARSNAMMILKNGNVGIGVSPVALFHSHQTNNSSKGIMKLTNSLSGITATDGLDIGFEPNVANARLWNYENGSLSIGTNNTERINISSTGNVGIGVNNTLSYKLYVNGSTAIIGNVLINSLAGTGLRPVHVDANGFLVEGTAVTSTNTYSKYHNVSAANARNIGSTPSTNFTYMATACLAYFSSAVKKGDGQIVMPVEFPDDAILGEMAIHAVDNVSTDFLEASLIRVPRIGTPTSQTIIATVNTASLTSSANVQAATLSMSPVITVDNANFYYYILVDISSGGANWGNNALALRGVRFKYSITY
ncbi:hypothetical protein [Emticicia sp. SJ17W-69]|uniref:hypothetical protein n=1 Tax=Emticicia sp. SJ17W-69 TaxID=3421657 RepID=UPI003EBE66C0